MSYVYPKVDDLEGTAKVGTKECAVLVQYYAKAPPTTSWKPGADVLGSPPVAKGTAIATFVNGAYPNKGNGNHAALYISRDAAGIYVMDQWSNDVTKPKVSKRYLRKKGKNPDGTFVDPSNNAEAFSVIEPK
jgi:hypothetical protein